MTDSGKNLQKNIDKLENPELSLEERKDVDQKDLSETKISVGMEAGEIIESVGIGSGKISEKEKKAQGKYGEKFGTKSSKTIKRQIKAPPSVPKMKSQVKSQLKKEIRHMNKKIKKVMRKGGDFEPYQLNKLVKKLRNLKEILSSLAYATTEMLRDLWIKYVKDAK